MIVMLLRLIFVFLLFGPSFLKAWTSYLREVKSEATQYLDFINKTFSHYGNLEMEARWKYITDITPEHEETMVRR